MPTEMAGMYRVHDPCRLPKLVVGRFTILSQKPGWLWIQDGEDEGMEVPSADFNRFVVGSTAMALGAALRFITEEMVAQFYWGRF